MIKRLIDYNIQSDEYVHIKQFLNLCKIISLIEVWQNFP